MCGSSWTNWLLILCEMETTFGKNRNFVDKISMDAIAPLEELDLRIVGF